MGKVATSKVLIKGGMTRKLDAVIFLHHGLGDLVMALPLLDDIRSSQADCSRILVFVRCSSSYRMLDLLDYTRYFEVRILKRKLILMYPFLLSLRRPRVVLAPQSPGHWKMPLISKLIYRGKSIGPENITGGPRFDVTIPDHDILRESKIDYYRRFADLGGYAPKCQADVGVKMLPMELALAGKDRLRALQSGRITWIGLAPGSNPRESHKRWPIVRYVSLINELAVKNPQFRFLLLGSPSEYGLLDSIRNLISNTEAAFILTPVDVAEALAVYAACDCLVTGCNGASHMAGMLGTPIVTIYGPTNGANTGAWSPHRRSVRARLSCSPCYRLGFEAGCKNPICMAAVTHTQVMIAIEDLLANGGCEPIPWQDNSFATQPDITGPDQA